MYQVDLELEVLPVWLVDPRPPGMLFRKTLNVYRKFQFIGNLNVTQYFVTIVRSHFQLLKFHIKTHGVAGKQYVFSAQKVRKRSFFSEALAGISILTQWIPSNVMYWTYVLYWAKTLGVNMFYLCQNQPQNVLLKQ